MCEYRCRNKVTETYDCHRRRKNQKVRVGRNVDIRTSNYAGLDLTHTSSVSSTDLVIERAMCPPPCPIFTA